MIISPINVLGYILILIAFCSCEASQVPSQGHSSLIPLLPERQSLDDEVLFSSLQDFFRRTGAPASSQYSYSRFDLNGDGYMDALVFIRAPYGHWCDDLGCTLLILQDREQGFSVVHKMSSIRNPIYISLHKTNEWHDLVFWIYEKEFESRYVRLKYDSIFGYPDDLSQLTADSSFKRDQMTKIFP